MAIILGHQALGSMTCCGCITALEHGNGRSDLICNECGQRMRTDMPTEEVERELAGLAETCGYVALCCVHCGALNICTEIALTDALVCPRCGTGMVNGNN